MKINIGGKSFELTKEQIEKGEDVSLGDNFVVRTTDEENKFLNNIKSETSKAAIEIQVKKLRTDLGLEFEGKTIENLVEALTEKNKVEFTKEPSEILKQKEKDLEILKAKVKELDDSKRGIETEYLGYKNNLKLEKELIKNIPDNVAIPKEDVLMLIKNKLNPVVDGDRVVFKKGSEIMKDNTTLDPLGADKVLSDFFAENKQYLKTPQGGQGGKDEPGADKGNSIQQWRTKYEQSGGDMSSESVNKAMQEAIKNKEISF